MFAQGWSTICEYSWNYSNLFLLFPFGGGVGGEGRERDRQRGGGGGLTFYINTP